MIFESLNPNPEIQSPPYQNSPHHNIFSSQESNPHNANINDTFNLFNQDKFLDENSFKDISKELPLTGLSVYVEVMSNYTNISETCYQYLEKLGAKVEKRMNRKCNLVIWKDGNLKTIEKAKEYNVTVVNSLWLEDCVEKFHRADVEKFLPELPSETDLPFLCFRNKMKKQKSFDPSNCENFHFLLEDKENGRMPKPSIHKRRRVNFERHSDEKKKNKGRRFDCKKNLSPLFDTNPFKPNFYSQGNLPSIAEHHFDSADAEKSLFSTQATTTISPIKIFPPVNENLLEESLIKEQSHNNSNQKNEKPNEEPYDITKVKNMILKYVSSYRLGPEIQSKESFSDLKRKSAQKNYSLKSSARKTTSPRQFLGESESPKADDLKSQQGEEEEKCLDLDLDRSLSIALSKLQPLANMNDKRAADFDHSDSSDPDSDESETELQAKSQPSKKIKINEEKEVLSINQPNEEFNIPETQDIFNSEGLRDLTNSRSKKNSPKNQSGPKYIKPTPNAKNSVFKFSTVKCERGTEMKTSAPKRKYSPIKSAARNDMLIENERIVQITDDEDEDFCPTVTRRKRKTNRKKKFNVQKVLRELAENDEFEGKAKLDLLDSQDIVLLLKEMINNDLKGDDDRDDFSHDVQQNQEEETLPEISVLERIEEEKEFIEQQPKEVSNNESEGVAITFKIQCHAFSDEEALFYQDDISYVEEENVESAFEEEQVEAPQLAGKQQMEIPEDNNRNENQENSENQQNIILVESDVDQNIENVGDETELQKSASEDNLASIENLEHVNSKDQAPMKAQNQDAIVNEDNQHIDNAQMGDTLILSVTESQKSSIVAPPPSENVSIEQSFIVVESGAVKEAEKPLEEEIAVADNIEIEEDLGFNQSFIDEQMEIEKALEEIKRQKEQESAIIHQENIDNNMKPNSKLLFTDLSFNGLIQAKAFCKQHNFQLIKEEKPSNIPEAEYFIYDGEELPPTFAIAYALLNKQPLIRSDWLVESLIKNELQDYRGYLMKFEGTIQRDLFLNLRFFVDKEFEKPLKIKISNKEISGLVEELGGLIVDDIQNCDYYITKQPAKKRKNAPSIAKTVKPQWIIDSIIQGKLSE